EHSPDAAAGGIRGLILKRHNTRCDPIHSVHSEHVVGCSEAEALSGPMIQSFHGEANLFRLDGIEAALLGEVLAHQAIGVLVGAALPGGVRRE
ncbi:MAG: hypothetical protein ACK4N4_13445, partial [Burkholderiales bacterium]